MQTPARSHHNPGGTPPPHPAPGARIPNPQLAPTVLVSPRRTRPPLTKDPMAGLRR